MTPDTTINVFYTPTPDYVEPEKIQYLLEIIPDFVNEKLRRITHATKRNECIAGLLLLSRALSGYCQGETILKELQISALGKPYIKNATDFNISHSSGYTICCVAPHCNVGVDIEKWTPIDLSDFADYLPQHVLTDIQHSGHTLKSFYDYWTRLESVVKADGRGLLIAPESVAIYSDRALVFNKQWYIKQINLLKGYSCCVAYDQLKSSFKINKIDP